VSTEHPRVVVEIETPKAAEIDNIDTIQVMKDACGMAIFGEQ